MLTIHIFNPDTDYALASGLDFYTPPASVVTMRRSMALLPADWALPGEALLLQDPPFDVASLRDLRVGDTPLPVYIPSDEGSFSEAISGTPLPSQVHIEPWGWNRDLRRRLLAAGVSEECLPTPESLDRLRALSHRRTTIPFNRMIGLYDRSVAPLNLRTPVELCSDEEVMNWLAENPGGWLKAPWSSSGRGVLRTSDLEERHIRPWARGIIRRQGSVMAEPGVDRLIDFATEWHCADGKARFLGLSLFETSPRGKYQANLHLPQHEIEERIKKGAPDWGAHIIEAQRRALETLIAPEYSGPLGIDMMVDTDGLIYPCVELNLRRTMGAISLYRRCTGSPITL